MISVACKIAATEVVPTGTCGAVDDAGRMLDPRVALRAWSGTCAGPARGVNQDAVFVSPDGRLAIVADGMGGRPGGEVASAVALAAVRQHLAAVRGALVTHGSRRDPGGRRAVREILDRAVQRANQAVLDHGDADAAVRGMGTMLDVIVILGDEAFIAHVGDGRVYLIRGATARQVTDDHTVAEVMRRTGAITAAEAEQSPMRSVLSNAIGIGPTTAIDQVHVRLQPGDRLLACTDGLYDHLSSDDLADRLCGTSARPALDGLLALARGRGGDDDVSVALIDIALPAPLRLDALDATPGPTLPGAP